MNKSLQNILRWISILPGSIIAGILSTVLLHVILYSTLTPIVTPYPELPERILTPFAFTMMFILAGYNIAPGNKLKVVIILFAISIFLSGGFIMTVLTGGEVFGKKYYFQVSGISALMGIVGAFVGLYLAASKNKEIKVFPTVTNSSNDQNLQEKKFSKVERKTLYHKFKSDLLNLLFISLFVLCILNEKIRFAIFIILLLIALLGFIMTLLLDDKPYTRRTKKNLAKDIIFSVALIIGLINKFVGLYVSIFFLALYVFEFIKHVIVTHLNKKKSPKHNIGLDESGVDKAFHNTYNNDQF